MNLSAIPPPFPTTKPASAEEETAERERTASQGLGSDTTYDERRSVGSLSDEAESSGTIQERLTLALACRDSGNMKLNEGDIGGAIELYEDGIAKLKGADNDEMRVSVQHARRALNLNLSLCRIRQREWLKAIAAASDVLSEESTSVKALYRRGLARSRLGMLEEAREDFLAALKVDSGNFEVRKELASLKQLEQDAMSRAKMAFGGLFARSSGLYDDREKQVAEAKYKAAEDLKKEMKEFEAENERLEREGLSPVESFDEWRKQKEGREKKEAQNAQKDNNMEKPISARSGCTATVHSSEFDEEDRRILDETKKMGYCYFNRKIDETEKGRLQEQSRPVKLEASAAADEESLEKALSSWNKEGTTYEERDCSSWARGKLEARMRALRRSMYPSESGIAAFFEKASTRAPMAELAAAAASLLPVELAVTSVAPIEGDAQIIVLRASKRYLYDMKIELKWSAKLGGAALQRLLASEDFVTQAASLTRASFDQLLNSTNDVTEISGKLALTDVSSASTSAVAMDCPEWLRDGEVTIDGSAPCKAAVLNATITMLKSAVLSELKLFEEEFKSLL